MISPKRILIRLLPIFCLIVIFLSGKEYLRRQNIRKHIDIILKKGELDDVRDTVLLDYVSGQEGKPITYCDDEVRCSLLHIAVKLDDPELINELLELGADPVLQGYLEWEWGIQYKHYGCIELDTPLHFAAECDSVDAIKALLDAGVSVDIEDQYGRPPLYKAAYNGSKRAAEQLLNYGANVNKSSVDGWTPVYAAANQEDTSMVSLLVEYGADPNLGTPDDSPLHQAVRSSDRPTIRVLLKAGADRNKLDNKGRRPVDWAISDYLVELLEPED